MTRRVIPAGHCCQMKSAGRVVGMELKDIYRSYIFANSALHGSHEERG